jgi:mRNA interferase RelE/StbE
MFAAIFSDEALSYLKKLDDKAAERILDKIDGSLAAPERFFKRLSGREEFRLRIGDYRAIARILVQEKKVFIISIGHRKNVYGKK